MKNILVLTNLYPAPDLPKENTPVVHYFTRQWVQLGYNVLVIHYPTNFPKFVMKIASLFKKRLSAFLPATIRTFQARELEYKLEGVTVKRIPMLKYKMHGRFSVQRMDLAVAKTLQFLDDNSFQPDIIVSHWANPTLEISYRLKRKFHCKSAYISHFAPEALVYGDDSNKYIKDIDIIGFRSNPIKNNFLRLFDYKGATFHCYSGIPTHLIPNNYPQRKFDAVLNFVFVGTLIKRKYPAEIVPAVYNAIPNAPFSIKYIGQGAEESRIKSYAKKFGVASQVEFLGYIPRDNVAKILSTSDVFVMNSKNEAFGLVYLEAMAQGCITIASAGEGFDGIIIDGYNGFLCRAGDVDDLSNTIKRISLMSKEQLQEISINAYNTAKTLTDENAARLYIDELKSIMKV